MQFECVLVLLTYLPEDVVVFLGFRRNCIALWMLLGGKSAP